MARAQRVVGALGAVARVGVDVEGAGGDVLAADGAVEDAVGGFGLVGGHLVAGLEDAREGEVAVLPDQAARVGGVGDDVGVAGGTEGGVARVGDLEGDGFAAEPWGGMSACMNCWLGRTAVFGGGESGEGQGRRTVAGIVPVTIHQIDFDTIIQEVSEILDLTAAHVHARVIANAAESFIDPVGRLGVVYGDTKCALHVVLGQVTEVIVRWERCRVNRRNVIVVAPRSVDVLRFDIVGAIDICVGTCLVDGSIVAGGVGVAFGS